jgi:hypothetical protein
MAQDKDKWRARDRFLCNSFFFSSDLLFAVLFICSCFNDPRMLHRAECLDSPE